MIENKVCRCPPDEYKNPSGDGIRCMYCGCLNFGYVIYAKTEEKKLKEEKK